MKKIILLLTLVIYTGVLLAQQQSMVSQYMFNGLFLNPGYTGSHGKVSTNLHYRSQWAGFDGAPKTSILSVDGMLKDNKNSLGLILSHDKIGVTSQSDLLLNYAYHIKTGTNSHLSLGLRGGFGIYGSDAGSLKVWDSEDEMFTNPTNNKFVPQAGFGAYYYSSNYFAGISIPTLIAYDKEESFNLDVQKSSIYHRHYYLHSGIVHTINDDVKIKPTVLIKYLPEAPVQADLNVNFLFYNMIWTGVSYRTGEAIVGIAEYQTDFGLRIGYSFDYTLKRIRNFSYGSHEILLGYDIVKKKSSSSNKNPRLL
ncbi:MAG: type IX secretion system membrane protein PorP/SprF [Bacteroidetes bacterium]|nr:type IX secretion system membrane protein PorP/SprF [Bacteroidota bacterium]HET6244357.1 type IX secretion system membrane protein PorP/SprF [Bacteroidia bacterium]